MKRAVVRPDLVRRLRLFAETADKAPPKDLAEVLQEAADNIEIMRKMAAMLIVSAPEQR
jgi:hypothetical protein